MSKKTLNPEGLPVPRGSYFQVAVSDPGRIVTIAGQTASGIDGEIVGVGDIKVQVREVLRKIQVGVESVGGKIEDIVTCTVYITDARFYSDVNETRREVFGPSFPASTMVQVVSLARPGLLVEINATAVVPEANLTV
jgi:enamine deaminase RidA (YjgF/YER057c/UK114 family)